MSQITTCPSCGTRFRVVADQLRISDGWVRCGQCQEVFDARNHLDAAVEAEPDVTPDEVLAPVSAPVAKAVTPAAAVQTPVVSAAIEPAVAPVSEPAVDRVVRVPLPPVRDMPSFGATPPAPIPVSAPAAVPAPAPGYELPVPQWSDDLDLSEYHPAPEASAVPEPVSLSRGAMVSGSTLGAKEAPLLPAAESAEPAMPTPARAEPVWNANAAPRTVSPPDFPALDPSMLEAGAPLRPEVARPEAVAAASAMAGGISVVASQNGLQSATDAQNQLSETEHLLPQAVGAATAASVPQPVHAPAVAGMAAPSTPDPVVGPPAHVLAEDAGPATVPVDEIESAAQKLAQAEPWPAAGAASAAAPAFPFAAPADDDDPLVLDSSLEPGFVRDARRKAWWQKPMVRVAMGAGVVVLPVALALQVALHERNALVAWQPSLRPALEFMCTALQCKLGPRQQIAAMVVSGSAFAKGERERAYQLSLSIQNRASTPVGMPAVELTLTDAQDQAIARKVISAKELGAPQELKAGAEWSGTVPVTTDGLNLQVSGYRVLLFYP